MPLLDRSLVILGAVVVVSAASAAIWHLILKRYLWAVVGSSLTVGLVTYLAYPIFRDVSANGFILVNALFLGAVFALGVGIPFKRRRAAERRAGNGA